MTTLIERVERAHEAIRPQVPVTPLEPSALLSELTGCQVYLKCEHLQRTGSFKFRGATHKLLALGESARATGVIAASTGNHGKAVALAGKLMGVPVTVYAPASAAPVKLKAIRALGGELVLVDGSPLVTELLAGKEAAAQGKPYISPYNDWDVLAGQGTIGMEMLAQCPDLDAIFIAVGGGGMISSIGSLYRSRAAHTKLIGCWPENATSLYSALQAGFISEVEETDTISDGTAGGVEPGAITFPICQEVIDEHCLVSEGEIKSAMRLLVESEQWMVEGAAGVALASLLKSAPQWQGRKVAAVLCGRNIMLEKFLDAL